MRGLILFFIELILALYLWDRVLESDWVLAGIILVVIILLPFILINRMGVNDHGVLTFLEKPFKYIKPGLFIRIPFFEKVVRVTKKPIIDDFKSIKVVTGQGVEKIMTPDPTSPTGAISKDQLIGRYELDVDFTQTLSYPKGKALVRAIPYLPTDPKQFAKDVKVAVDAAVFQYVSTPTWLQLLDKIKFSRDVEANILAKADPTNPAYDAGSVITKYKLCEEEFSIEIKNINLPSEAQEALVAVETARLKAMAAPTAAIEDALLLKNLVNALGGDDQAKQLAAKIFAMRGLARGTGIVIDPTKI